MRVHNILIMQQDYGWRSTANTVNTVQNLLGANETENSCSQVKKEIMKFFFGGGGAGVKKLHNFSNID